MSRITEARRRPWRPHPERELRLDSAARIAEFAVGTAELYEAHRNELLSLAVWKATELDGKWDTRYRSREVVRGVVGTPINHEHVVPRLALRAAAVSCLVTTEEHARLGRVAPPTFGWQRYVLSGIQVFDMADNEPLDLASADEDLRAALGVLDGTGGKSG
jgi:hypothetical protein